MLKLREKYELCVFIAYLPTFYDSRRLLLNAYLLIVRLINISGGIMTGIRTGGSRIRFFWGGGAFWQEDPSQGTPKLKTPRI